MNFYPHHIGDYRADTAHLSNEEDLAYRRLLEMYYDTEQPIPLETQWVSRRLRLDTQAIEVVLNDFFSKADDGWHHTRCDREISSYQRLQLKNRENGKKGGRPKAAQTKAVNPVGYQSDANGIPVATHSEGNHEPLTNNQEPKREKASAAPPFVLPDWIDSAVWDIWHQHPKRRKLTNGQKQLAVDKLAAWRAAGVDYAQALNNSATNGWQGLFEPDAKRGAGPAKGGRLDAAARTIFRDDSQLPGGIDA